MKRITLLLLFLSASFLGYGQIKNYTFSQSTDYFSPISAGTLLGDTYSEDQKFLGSQGNPFSNTGNGLPIGFSFVFNGYSYDRFAINDNGWISLGDSTLSPSVNLNATNSYAPLSSTNPLVTGDLSAKICALANNLQAQTNSSLRFQTIGSAPNQTLVVQWLNYKKSGNGGTGDSFSFQIRLHETSNTVDIVYGTMTSNSTANANYQVGLRAEPVATANNFVCRNSTSGWDATDAGDTAAASVLMTSGMTPYSGLIYTWTPPTCGGAKGLVVNSISTNSAVLNWSAYKPLPSSGYEYVVSTSAVLPTGSGTATNGTNVSVSSLSASTLYNVFLRSKCGSDFTAWTLAGSFKTRCPDTTSFIENFDSYPTTDGSIPNCWSVAGNGSVNIYSGSANPGSAPNRLYMYGDGSTTIPTVSYVILPPVSNLQSATHQLRLKAYATSADRTFDVGYFTNVDDLNTFVSLRSINLPSTAASSATEFTIAPPALPSGVKNLVFKNSGISAGSTALYIDDVIWESISGCSDIKNLTGKGITSNSVNISWTAGGTETAWQYVCGLSSVSDPNTLTPIMDVTTKSVTVSGLNASTTYKIWVRSKCGTNLYGSWIGAFTFTTTCAPVAEFAQNFDASTVFPSCWGKLGTTIATNVGSLADSSSSPNSLSMYTAWNAPSVITVMPPVSNSTAGNHRLRFKYKGAAVGATFDVGYLSDVYDAESFTVIRNITATTTSFSEVSIAPGSVPSPYLAFKMTGTTSSTVYIDDVVWELVPACYDIVNPSSYQVNTTSASLSWTAGGSETSWQYALGTSTQTDPDALSIVDVTSKDIKINGLSVNTSYKVWIRSKCNSTTKGTWVGPVAFTTTCESTASLVENFDASSNLPSCWKKVGSTGAVYTASPLGSGMPSPPSGPNVLFMESSSASGPAIVALPPLSNSAEGIYRLRFKIRGSVNNAALEVGFLTNLSDPTSFSPLKTLTATTDFTTVTAALGQEPASDILAFRGASPSTILIDDVIWELVPTCGEIINPKATEISSTAIGFSWGKAGSATSYQYAIGTAAAKDPEGLPLVDVTTTSAKANGLDPATTYKIWVRTKCAGASTGDWSSPIIISTTCTPSQMIAENFDAGTSLPACWSKIGSQGSAYVAAASENAIGANVLNIYSSSDNAMAVVALPAISTTTATDYMLKFKLKASMAGANMEVGYLTNISDPSTFISLKSFTASSTSTFDNMSLAFQGPLPSQILAFRNIGIPASSVYIDEVFVDEASRLGVDTFDVSDFSFYPNPVKDILNISLDKEINNITILNLLGQQVFNQSNTCNQMKIDMSGLTSGTYMVKVTSENQSKTIKVIKE